MREPLQPFEEWWLARDSTNQRSKVMHHLAAAIACRAGYDPEDVLETLNMTLDSY